MSGEELAELLSRHSDEVKDYLDNDFPIDAGKLAVDYFTESFQKEGWEGEPWKEVQRRVGYAVRNGKTVKLSTPKNDGQAPYRKILTGVTGDLGRSVEVDTSRSGSGEVVVWTNPTSFRTNSYGAFHNEGTPTLPKRQFMGESDTLNQQVIDKVEERISNILE